MTETLAVGVQKQKQSTLTFRLTVSTVQSPCLEWELQYKNRYCNFKSLLLVYKAIDGSPCIADLLTDYSPTKPLR